MKKKVGIIKRIFSLLLVFLFSINSFAAVVSDNDGSAFISKAEFDSLKNSFQSQIDSYNKSIDSKIDGAIAQYLAGIRVDEQPKFYVDMLNSIIFKKYIVDNADLYNNAENWQQFALLSTGFIQEYDYWGSSGSSSTTTSGYTRAYHLFGSWVGTHDGPINSDGENWNGYNTSAVGPQVYSIKDEYNIQHNSAAGRKYKTNTDYQAKAGLGQGSVLANKYGAPQRRGSPLYIFDQTIDIWTRWSQWSGIGEYTEKVYMWQTWNDQEYYCLKPSATSSSDTLTSLTNFAIKSGPRTRETDVMVRRPYSSYFPTINATGGQWSRDMTGATMRAVPEHWYYNRGSYDDQIYWDNGYIKLYAKWNKRSWEGNLVWFLNYSATPQVDVKPTKLEKWNTGTQSTSVEFCFFDGSPSGLNMARGTVGFGIDTNSKITPAKYGGPLRFVDYYGLESVDLAYEIYGKNGNLQKSKTWFWQNGQVVPGTLGSEW